MTIKDKASDFLGLHGEDNDGVPNWQGLPSGTAWRITVTWIAIAIGAFVLLQIRMPDNDGFGGFVPLWFSVTIGIAGLFITERMMIRREGIRS